VPCDSGASARAGVSNCCGTEGGGGTAFGVSLEWKGVEVEGLGFDGDSEADPRCSETTGRNSVPPFSQLWYDVVSTHYEFEGEKRTHGRGMT